MTIDRLDQGIAEYDKARGQLRKALAQPRDELLRDSVVQRFAFCYGLAWKMRKHCLAVAGITVRTPRESLQQALAAGFIDDGKTRSELQWMRNLTSHTDDEALADAVCVVAASTGLGRFERLQQGIGSWRTQRRSTAWPGGIMRPSARSSRGGWRAVRC